MISSSSLSPIRRVPLKKKKKKKKKKKSPPPQVDKRLARVAELLDEAVRTTKSEERKASYREAAKEIADLKVKRAELGEAVKRMLAVRGVDELLHVSGHLVAFSVEHGAAGQHPLHGFAELGEAVKRMLAGRAVLYAEGDQMAADVQKFVDAAAGQHPLHGFAEPAKPLKRMRVRGVDELLHVSGHLVAFSVEHGAAGQHPLHGFAELGDAVKQMLAGREVLYTEGDQMAADVQKFVDAAGGTPFANNANVLESKVLLTRVANWRMLATRDAKGFATFKANVGKAQEQIAQLEKLDLTPELAGLLKPVKSGVAKYADAFDKTGPNLVRGDDLYYHSVTPLITGAIDKMDKVTVAIDAAFKQTTAETGNSISSAITTRRWSQASPCCLVLPSPS